MGELGVRDALDVELLSPRVCNCRPRLGSKNGLD